MESIQHKEGSLLRHKCQSQYNEAKCNIFYPFYYYSNTDYLVPLRNCYDCCFRTSPCYIIMKSPCDFHVTYPRGIDRGYEIQTSVEQCVWDMRKNIATNLVYFLINYY